MCRGDAAETALVLETERLVLHPFRPEDAPAIFAYAADPEVARYTGWAPHRSLDDTGAFLRRVAERHRDEGLPSWAIWHRGDGVLIGQCEFLRRSSRDGWAEIGYALSRARWGRGYTAEALRAVVTFGFSRLGLNRVQGTCQATNRASARVMEKVGMTLEGTLRESWFADGAYRDRLLYAVLRREWPG